jgi:hypothetical protein
MAGKYSGLLCSPGNRCIRSVLCMHIYQCTRMHTHIHCGRMCVCVYIYTYVEKVFGIPLCTWGSLDTVVSMCVYCIYVLIHIHIYIFICMRYIVQTYIHTYTPTYIQIAVGGVAPHVTELAAGLERRGHEVHGTYACMYSCMHVCMFLCVYMQICQSF